MNLSKFKKLTNTMNNIINNSHSDLTNAKVSCSLCQFTMQVDAGSALQNGWPKCCGYTMILQSSDRQNKNSNVS